MFNFLISACGGASAAAGNGCYDWPVIKQIVWLFSEVLGYLYKFLDMIGIANIGLVIIIFTIIVKLIVLPLTIRQQKFTKLTNVMQPELSAIQNRYKGQRDQYSMQAMQAETKAVYAKYGVSQTGGCLQSFISFPILIAMYGALRNIPTAIDKIAAALTPVANIITTAQESETMRDGLATVSSALVNGDSNTIISTLYTLPTKGWAALQALFTGTEAQTIASNHQTFVKLNSFLGWDISQSPWNLMLAGGVGIIAVLIPLIAGFSQWLSFKLTQTKQSAASNDQSAATSRMMGIIMPLFSVYICFTLNTGLGIYWCMSSLFQVILQILINKHYRKIDMDKFVEENMKKAEEKAKKKREKGGVAGSTISSAAAINTKNINAQGQAQPSRPMSIAEKANIKVDDAHVNKTAPPANSLAARAGMVQQYNEDHPEDAVNRKKYKK